MSEKIDLSKVSDDDLKKELLQRLKDERLDEITKLNELEFNISELKHLTNEDDEYLYIVQVEDGSEGCQFIVEVERDIEEYKDYETEIDDEFVTEYVTKWLIANEYYTLDRIDSIRAYEICRYQRGILKISNPNKDDE